MKADGMGTILMSRAHGAVAPRRANPRAMILERILELRPACTSSFRDVVQKKPTCALFHVSKSGLLVPLTEKILGCRNIPMVVAAEHGMEGKAWPVSNEDCRSFAPLCVFHKRIIIEERKVFFGFSGRWKASTDFFILCENLNRIGAVNVDGHSLWKAASAGTFVAAKGTVERPDTVIMSNKMHSPYAIRLTVLLAEYVENRHEKYADVYILASHEDWKISYLKSGRLDGPCTGDAADALKAHTGWIFSKAKEILGVLLDNPRIFNIIDVMGKPKAAVHAPDK